MSETTNLSTERSAEAVVEFCTEAFGEEDILTQLAAVGDSHDELAGLNDVAGWDVIHSDDPNAPAVFRAWYTYIVHQLVDAEKKGVLDKFLTEIGVDRPGESLEEAAQPHTDIENSEIQEVVATLEELFGPNSAIVDKVVTEVGPSGQADITEAFDDAEQTFDADLDPALGKAGALADALSELYKSQYQTWLASE